MGSHSALLNVVAVGIVKCIDFIGLRTEYARSATTIPHLFDWMLATRLLGFIYLFLSIKLIKRYILFYVFKITINIFKNIS